MRARVVIAAVAAVFAGLLAPAADAKRRGCRTRGEATVVANERARVFVADRNPDDDGEYYACLYGERRDRRLGTTSISSSGGRDAAWFQFASPSARHQLMAFAREDCGDVCSYTARTIDLDTGRVLRQTGGAELLSLLLAGRASLATLERPTYDWEPTSYRVTKVEASGTTILDEGPDIDPYSLAVSGHWVYWRRAGMPRSAYIR